MATAALQIGSDRWIEQVNEVLSLATEMVTGLDHPTGLAMFSAWRTNRWLDWMNREVERILAAIDTSVHPGPEISTESLRSARESILGLHVICLRLLSLREVAGQDGKKQEKLALLEANSAQLLDVAHGLDAMNAPRERAR
jgi:hypothetical protein